MMDFQADRIEHGHPRCGPNWWFALLLFGLMMGSPMLWGQDRILGDPSIDASETAMRGSQRNVNFFESKIRPLLAKHCYECHSEPAGKMEAGLRVDTAAGLRRGGAGGPAVVPGKPSQSRLMQSVRYDDPTLRMPPEEHGGKLSDEAIATLEKWILAGAFDPRGPTAWEEPTPATDWWAFQPLPANRPTPPQVENSSWCYDPIDQFIASAHRNKGLMPVADAAPETLMRRVALDLTGLPPSEADLRWFHQQQDQLGSFQKAYVAWVDRLLDSRDFAIHFGRHWLDVARFGESTGKEINVSFPHAWRYRDWVIDAIDQELPYDQFLREQIAGDLLESSDSSDQVRRTIATGFLAIGPKSINEPNPLQFQLDLADEQIDATFQATMALTVACARCHDHLFDPITQRDYTAVAGIFLSTETLFGTASGGVNNRNGAKLAQLPGEVPSALMDLDPERIQGMKERLKQLTEERNSLIRQRIEANRKGGDNNAVNPRILALATEIADAEAELQNYRDDGKAVGLAMAVRDKPLSLRPIDRRLQQRRGGFETIGESPLFVRGEPAKASDKVPRSVPRLFGDAKQYAIPSNASGRLQLADWIVSPDNPMTARVAVNRIWYWLFGQGLVTSLDNFGMTGDHPSHPELLDALAIDFRDGGWNLKAMVRRIVTSHTYQLAAEHRAENFQIDPDNRLLWRANRKRLTAEAIRDSILTVAGIQLRVPENGSVVAAAGDGPIGAPRRAGLREEQIVQADGPYRSIYLPNPRGLLPEILEVFDMPDGTIVQSAREVTNVPTQSLFLLNSRFAIRYAKKGAQRILEAFPGDRAADAFGERLELAYRWTLSRRPTASEARSARELLSTDRDDPLAAWTLLVQGLMATAEFRYLD